MRSAEEPAGVLLRPCSCGRGGTLQKCTPPRCFTLADVALASWKRTPPCCCALAGVVALCRSARRRAVVLWLAWRSVEAHAAVLLCSGWRGALQKRTPPCCCALAGVVAAQQSRAPPGEGGLFDPPEGGAAGPGMRSRRPGGVLRGLIFGPACGAPERPAALAQQKPQHLSPSTTNLKTPRF